jgi:hypothetical protein
MRDDGPGGSSEPSVPADYAHLRIAVWAWRLRIGCGVIVGTLVMEGQASAIAVLGALGIAALVMLGGTVAARLEWRVRSLRSERRR